MNLHGFEILNKEYLDELNGDYYLLKHKKTGARLVFIKNDDNNRVFYIGFRTPSNNSTGVAHILEHSTLCGSEKYPVKEPFVELIKGSLNTFLNAMTYPDKTVYPIASTNKKDFRNLEDVYLDAVFNPNIYNNPYTFKQEGWHYHLENKDEPLKYNGVVYNEMKGVYSDPNAVLENGILESLYPDNIYSKESGGAPENIPDLTYEDFLNFHDTFYHPSNSYIYVYGDNDLEEELEYLDSWLNKYNQKEIDSSIRIQKPFDEIVEKNIYYAVNPEDSTKNKDMIALNYGFAENPSPLEIKAFRILADYLLEDLSSVLKKELASKNLAGDIDYVFETSLQQPFFSIVLKDTDISKKDEFIETVNNVLNRLVKEGIDKDELEAVINIKEFKDLERLNGENLSYPKGLFMGLNLLDNWLYNEEPVDQLKIFDQYKKINEFKDSNYFEKLIETLLINNSYKSLVLLQPDKELLKEQEKRLKAKLENYKNSLDEEQIDELIKETQNLLIHQNKEDSPEDLKKIPRLEVNEIDKESKNIKSEIINDYEYPVIYVENNKGNIVYLALNFNFLNISQEDLPYVRILDEILAEVSTREYDYQKLNKELNRFTGGINTSVSVKTNIKTGDINPIFSIITATKTENLKQTIHLLDEIINYSFYNEKNIIHDVIQSLKIQKKTIIQNQGNAIAALRLQAGLSKSGRIYEELEGINFYNFLNDLDEKFDEYWDALSQKLEQLSKQIFNINNLVVSVSSNKDSKTFVLNEVNKLCQTFSKDEIKQNEYQFENLTESEIFLTPGNVQYNAKGGRVELSDDDIGPLRVLKTLLSMDYLWNKVRVLGGAYGVNFAFSRLGDIIFSSFRDPALDQTFQNYDNSVEYIKNLNISQEEIDKYIIGTISQVDYPISTKQELLLATDMFFTGITNELRQTERDQILKTDIDDLHRFADIIGNIVNQGRYVTIGTQQALDNNNTRYNEINFVK